ncbi:MAG: glycoside hydrolase family 3 C-terminal domain-containing protein, partial [Anaerolineaceae bacterium]
NIIEILPIPPEQLISPDGGNKGLVGEFFTNLELEGEPAFIGFYPTTSFWWYGSSPAENIPLEKFSARLSGSFNVPESGHYQVQLINSSTARLFIDGNLILSNHADEVNLLEGNFANQKAMVDLKAGQNYQLRIEYVKESGEPFINLQWKLGRKYLPGEDVRLSRAVELAQSCDAAIIFAGYPEQHEHEGDDRPDMDLTGPQTGLIRAVAKANRNTIVVLNSGAPVTMPWLGDVPAVMQAYYPGMEGGNAIARILFGEVNPSGKLSVTYPKRLEDTPAFENYPGGRVAHYGEGIFVGYRHYDLREIEPLFPFGHGLSYTTFEYHAIVVDNLNSGFPIRVRAEIKNAGKRAGKEVVQLYVRDVKSSLARPAKELKGFAKVSLQPGETKTVTFELDERALSFFDPVAHAWRWEHGEFEILLASSSRDIRQRTTITLE